MKPFIQACFLVLCLLLALPSCDKKAGLDTKCDAPPAPEASYNEGLHMNDTLKLSVNEKPGTRYVWSGPDGFVSYEAHPIIPYAVKSKSGIYKVKALVNDCFSEETTLDVKINIIPDCDPPLDSLIFTDVECCTDYVEFYETKFKKEDGKIIEIIANGYNHQQLLIRFSEGQVLEEDNYYATPDLPDHYASGRISIDLTLYDFGSGRVFVSKEGDEWVFTLCDLVLNDYKEKRPAKARFHVKE